MSRHGSGTYVAGNEGSSAPDASPSSSRGRRAAGQPAVPGVGAQAGGQRLAYDFFPGTPDLAAFPRAAWLRAVRDVLRDAPDLALHYPDPAGTPELRAALAARLPASAALHTSAQQIVITTGARQGLATLGRALVAGGARRIAVEWPTIPVHIDVLAASGLDVARIPVRGDGIDIRRLTVAARTRWS